MSDNARSRRDALGLAAMALGAGAAAKVAESVPPPSLPPRYYGGHTGGGMSSPSMWSNNTNQEAQRQYDDWHRAASATRDRELAILQRRTAAIWRCKSTSHAYKELMAYRIASEERSIFDRFETLRSAAWRYLLGD